tara:strand:+ start:487 stop:1554 length:1068 start_codon:yes stop_codon:yes gene_type:complete
MSASASDLVNNRIVDALIERLQKFKDIVVDHLYRQSMHASRTTEGVSRETDCSEYGDEGELPSSRSNQMLGEHRNDDNCTSENISSFFTPSVDKDTCSQAAAPPEGTVLCPICNATITKAFINQHLDTCISRAGENESTGTNQTSSYVNKPMSYPVFRLMTEKAIRSKLSELGVNSTGGREVLVKRYKEFILQYNAACDAAGTERAVSVKEIARTINRMQFTASSCGAAHPQQQGQTSLLQMLRSSSSSVAQSSPLSPSSSRPSTCSNQSSENSSSPFLSSIGKRKAMSDNDHFQQLIEEIRARKRAKMSSNESDGIGESDRVRSADEVVDSSATRKKEEGLEEYGMEEKGRRKG